MKLLFHIVLFVIFVIMFVLASVLLIQAEGEYEFIWCNHGESGHWGVIHRRDNMSFPFIARRQASDENEYKVDDVICVVHPNSKIIVVDERKI